MVICLWRVVLDLLYRFRFRSSSTLNLIVFFGQDVSFKGMSTMSYSFVATCEVFIFCFLFCCIGLRVEERFVVLVFGLKME
jgi:thiamine transporter ThiT